VAESLPLPPDCWLVIPCNAESLKMCESSVLLTDGSKKPLAVLLAVRDGWIRILEPAGRRPFTYWRSTDVVHIAIDRRGTGLLQLRHRSGELYVFKTVDDAAARSMVRTIERQSRIIAAKVAAAGGSR